MQFILSEEELKKGRELRFAWKEERIHIDKVNERCENLHNQGYFTISDVVDCEGEFYDVYVFQRLYEITF